MEIVSKVLLRESFEQFEQNKNGALQVQSNEKIHLEGKFSKTNTEFEITLNCTSLNEKNNKELFRYELTYYIKYKTNDELKKMSLGDRGDFLLKETYKQLLVNDIENILKRAAITKE